MKSPEYMIHSSSKATPLEKVELASKYKQHQGNTQQERLLNSSIGKENRLDMGGGGGSVWQFLETGGRQKKLDTCEDRTIQRMRKSQKIRMYCQS